MPEAFDAYYKWLGISPKDQPPNHYRLLGIDVFEDNPDVITSAADQRMAHIRSFQAGQHSALSQRILNEIAAARICLLSPAKKAQYDEKLRAQLAALERRSRQAEPFDTSKIGLDFSATQASSVVTRPRHPHGTKLPWQLPAAIAAAILASVAIIAYLLSNPSEGEKPVTQAKADTPLKQADTGTKPKPKEEKPPKPESKPESKPEVKPQPKPEREPPKPEAKPAPQPEPKPEPKPQPKPEVVAEPPEKVAGRVKYAFAKAKTATDFRVVAIDALKLIDQANTAGKQDVAKSVVTLALSAARKADDDELAKMATICILEPGTKPTVTAEPPIGGTNSRVYLDDLKESDVHIGHGKLGKHGLGPNPDSQCRVNGVVPAHALIPHPPSNGVSSVSYRLAAQFSRFRSTVAIADGQGATPLTFRVRGDGRVLWESSPINKPSIVQKCNVSVEGVEVLSLEVSCPGNYGGAWSVWVDPFLIRQTSHSSGQQAAVPNAAAQEQALKIVREVFKDKYAVATTGEQQKALAQELLQKAQASTDDEARQYVMLKEAGRFTMQAKDADLVSWVIDEMGTRFEVDAFDLKAKALTAIGKSIGANEQLNTIVESQLALMDEAATKMKFDAAKQLGAMATDLARKSKDTALPTVKARVTEVAALARSYEQVKEAMTTLADNPSDSAANLAVGRYLCFAKGDWAKGVAMLALGNDETLRAIAIGELRGAASSDEQVKLADGWWETAASEKGTTVKSHLQERAKYWYNKALPGAIGLVKERIEKRLLAKVESQIESNSTILDALKKRLRGKVAYDAKTKRFVLMYDWRSENQLKDFVLGNAKPVLTQQTLVMRTGDSIRHIIDFAEVAIAVQVRVPKMQGMMIKTSGGAYARVGGLYPDTMYVGIDGGGDAQQFIVPDNQRTGVQPVKFTVEQSRLGGLKSRMQSRFEK